MAAVRGGDRGNLECGSVEDDYVGLRNSSSEQAGKLATDFSAGYGLLLAWQGKAKAIQQSRTELPVAVLATVYCVWLLYAAGLKYLLLSSLLYAPGAALYLLAKKQLGMRAFTGRERVILMALLGLAAVAAVLLATGRLGL